MATFQRSVRIDATVEDVYEFHLDTRNAAKIAGPGFRLVSVEGDFPLQQGAEVVLRMRQRPFPLTLTWRVSVTELDPPRRVVDETRSGPFARFRHEHRFEDLGGDATLLTDRIDYALPFGLVGRIADRLVFRWVLRAVFAARQAATARLLAADRQP